MERDRPVLTEIEITPEMIKAGMDCLTYSRALLEPISLKPIGISSDADLAAFVEEIFRAMALGAGVEKSSSSIS